jgi:hypothetical protein
MGGKKEDTGAQLRTGEQERKTLEYQKQLERAEIERQRREERDVAGIVGREAQSQFQSGLSDFQRATSGQPQQITRLQQLIREQALPEQQRAMEQGRIALQQQGVRGPEAALMLQQQANALQTDLANRAEQVALQQALQDRQAQQEFAMKRAMQTLPKALQRGLRGEQVTVTEDPTNPDVSIKSQDELDSEARKEKRKRLALGPVFSKFF